MVNSCSRLFQKRKRDGAKKMKILQKNAPRKKKGDQRCTVVDRPGGNASSPTRLRHA